MEEQAARHKPVGMDSTVSPHIFDRQRLRMRRDRMAAIARTGNPSTDFLAPIFMERLAERLDDLEIAIEKLLLVGVHGPGFAEMLRMRGIDVTLTDAGATFAATTGAIQCDEDQLLTSTLEPASFDAILWNGGLESTNDVPGALIQCRRLLRPNGVLLGVALGAGTLSTLRHIFRAMENGGAVARFHPQIDVRAMGDLMQRCGYVLPMADQESLKVRFGSIQALINDLRASGLTNCLAGPVYPVSRRDRIALATAFASCADHDGRVTEQFNLLYFTGWASASPSPK